MLFSSSRTRTHVAMAVRALFPACSRDLGLRSEDCQSQSDRVLLGAGKLLLHWIPC